MQMEAAGDMEAPAMEMDMGGEPAEAPRGDPEPPAQA